MKILLIDAYLLLQHRSALRRWIEGNRIILNNIMRKSSRWISRQQLVSWCRGLKLSSTPISRGDSALVPSELDLVYPTTEGLLLDPYFAFSRHDGCKTVPVTASRALARISIRQSGNRQNWGIDYWLRSYIFERSFWAGICRWLFLLRNWKSRPANCLRYGSG